MIGQEAWQDRYVSCARSCTTEVTTEASQIFTFGKKKMFCSILHSARASRCWEHGLWSFFCKVILFIYGDFVLKKSVKRPFDHFVMQVQHKNSSDRFSFLDSCFISLEKCKYDFCEGTLWGFAFPGFFVFKCNVYLAGDYLAFYLKVWLFYFTEQNITHSVFVL